MGEAAAAIIQKDKIVGHKQTRRMSRTAKRNTATAIGDENIFVAIVIQIANGRSTPKSTQHHVGIQTPFAHQFTTAVVKTDIAGAKYRIQSAIAIELAQGNKVMVPYIRDSAAAVEYACTVVVEDLVVDFGGIGIGFTETAVGQHCIQIPIPIQVAQGYFFDDRGRFKHGPTGRQQSDKQQPGKFIIGRRYFHETALPLMLSVWRFAT
jgi:hypothetical protein